MNTVPPSNPISSAAAAEAKRNARTATLVVWGLLTLGSALGVYVYFSATGASARVGTELESFFERGKSMSGVGCVNAVLDWFNDECAAPGRICLDAVPMAMGNCLVAQDRTADCEALGNDEKSSQWAFERCSERGIDKKTRKPVRESCTFAWRSIDTFCKSGQKGVAL